MRKLVPLLAATIMSIAAAGCSDDATAPGDGLTTITGTVLAMRNDFALDGGAEIRLLDDDDGQVKFAYLPSDYTSPPPSAEAMADAARVMRAFVELEVGDRAVVRGVLEHGALRMKYLQVQWPHSHDSRLAG